MKLKRNMSLALAAIMVVAGVAGCSKEDNSDKRVSITIGSWPSETDGDYLKKMEGYLDQYKEKYADVGVTTDSGNYADAKIFNMKAAAKQLPTMFNTHFTEIQQIIKDGYAADITNILKERGIYDAMNPEIRKLSEDENGNVYAYANMAYAMGLNINKDLFRKAGLVNEDGTAKVPETYEEMAEYAKIIKEKTGQAGFAICTANNCGGWHFMNIAWSFGVDFMEQRDDGTWEATFNTQECIDALQYVKDLKWKYDALPADTVIDQPTVQKLFAIGQAAMFFEAPKTHYTKQYDMKMEDFAMARMPEGPAGRYVQTGGSVYMFDKNATDEQINAAIDWIELIGAGKDLDDTSYANLEKSLKTALDNKEVVFPKEMFALWSDPARKEKTDALRAQYTNVDEKDFESYLANDGVILHAEEPRACQQLYAILDGCIQEVITNENADCAALIATACNDFQVNHLDKL